MDTKTRSVLGANVAALRNHDGLTQDQLAKRAGLSQRLVSGVERGEKSATVDTVDALASALRVPAWSLLLSVSDPLMLRDAAAAKLFARYVRLPRDGREQVDRVADNEARYHGDPA